MVLDPAKIALDALTGERTRAMHALEAAERRHAQATETLLTCQNRVARLDAAVTEVEQVVGMVVFTASSGQLAHALAHTNGCSYRVGIDLGQPEALGGARVMGTTLVARIRHALVEQDREAGLGAIEVAALVGADVQRCRVELAKLAKRNLATRVGQGQYRTVVEVTP